MFRASVGGRDAARRTVYRHSLLRVMSPLFAPLAAGHGWSALAVALCSVLMCWDAGPTLAQRFESALAVLDSGLPRRRRTGRTYQGFVKALSRRGGIALATLRGHLRTLTREAAGKHWRVGEFVPIGVDGSKFDAPRTVSNEALGIAGKDKSGPQMMTLLLVHLGAMLPLGWKVGNVHEPERTLLRRSLSTLPRNTLLVADAGFTGFDLLSTLKARRVSFLVRVGRGVHLLGKLGFYRREGKHTVYLWPDGKKNSPPLVLRLIRVGGVALITDVTDPGRLSRKTAAELYRRRWGLEVAFRSLKQTLERRKVRSGTATHAKTELSWAVAGMWALALLGVRAIARAGHGPRRLGLAATLAAARAAYRGGRSPRRLNARLRRCVTDAYRRRGSKRAYRWPHKKTQTQPGTPTLTIATPQQVLRAQQLRYSNTAA